MKKNETKAHDANFTSPPPPCIADVYLSNLKSIESADYEPYDCGKEDGIGYWGAVMHLVRMTLGSGILMIPFTFKILGYILGPCVLIVTGTVYYYASHTLLNIEHRLCKRVRKSNLTMIEIIETIFDGKSRCARACGTLCTSLIYAYMAVPMTNSLFLILLGTNIQKITAFFECIRVLDTTTLITAVTIFLTLVCSMNGLLKFLVPFSAAANIFRLIMVAIIVVFSFDSSSASNTNVKIKAVDNIDLVPQYLSVMFLAIRNSCLIFPLKDEMKQPKRLGDMAGVLNVSALTIIIFMCSFGISTYICYGETTDENILWNMPSGNLLIFFVFICDTFAIFVSYGLSFCIRFHCVWVGNVETRVGGAYKNAFKLLIKIIINVFGYAMAICVPQLTLFAAFSGTLGIFVEIVLPFLLDNMSISKDVENTRKFKLKIYKNFLMMSAALAIFVLCLRRCIIQII